MEQDAGGITTKEALDNFPPNIVTNAVTTHLCSQDSILSQSHRSIVYQSRKLIKKYENYFEFYNKKNYENNNGNIGV